MCRCRCRLLYGVGDLSTERVHRIPSACARYYTAIDKGEEPQNSTGSIFSLIGLELPQIRGSRAHERAADFG